MTTGTGLISESNINKAIIVDTRLDYEISFMAKNVAYPQTAFYFGVSCFDSTGAFVDMQNGTLDMATNAANSYFMAFNKSGNGSTDCEWTADDTKFTLIRGIIYSKNKPFPISSSPMNTVVGGNLKFNPAQDVRYIYPYIYIGNTGNNIYIYGIRVAPLATPYSRVFCNSLDLGIGYFNNNNGKYTDAQIEQIVGKYLLPVNVNPVLDTVSEYSYIQ